MTYELPKELIAQRPCEPRDAARLLVLDRGNGRVSHQVFQDLPEFLRPGDCLVLNDTRVIPARFFGRKADTEGKVELFILRQAQGERSRKVQDERESTYWCLGRPAKRLRPGARLVFDHGSLEAEVIAWGGGERLVRFAGQDLEQALPRLGQIPLPPYIGRPVEERDALWYQTVYACKPGAVAAPTAGLHFTEGLLEKIRWMGVRIAFVTLHVGWGTFKPVGEEELALGRLHPERFEVPAETMKAIEATRSAGGRVIAVGTTVVRALETIARAEVSTGGTTDLFIRLGFEFRVVDVLITNFHLPGTSLLYLVAAFAGEERMLAAYREAILQRYRFYSYGDAMLMA